jgi:hypothetical protein
LGEFFRDEVARPLGVEFYFGVPPSVHDERIAAVEGYSRFALLGKLNKLPPLMVLSGLWPQSLVAQSVRCLGFDNPATIGNHEFRRVEIPSANDDKTYHSIETWDRNVDCKNNPARTHDVGQG